MVQRSVRWPGWRERRRQWQVTRDARLCGGREEADGQIERQDGLGLRVGRRSKHLRALIISQQVILLGEQMRHQLCYGIQGLPDATVQELSGNGCTVSIGLLKYVFLQ